MSAELLMTIAAGITAAGVIIGALFAIYKVAKRIDQAIGVDKSGKTLSDRMERVEHQLWENGGSSLADRVNDIQKNTVKLTAEVDFLKDLTIGHKADELLAIEAEIVKPRATRARKK